MRLLFLEEPDEKAIAAMDLFNVAELKRVKGGFEVKFFDRFKAMELLARLCDSENGEQSMMPFYKALELGAKQTGGEEEGGTDE